MKAGRNTPCSCGSGRKYKLCCGGKSRTKSGFARIALWAGAAIFVLAAVLAFVSSPVGTDGTPGSPPPGKVWSAEHGHWHDVTPARQASQPVGRPGTPQPPGPPPPGKVWSTEHGHWHDAQ